MEPCESCKANNNPNCGNDWCHTRGEDEKQEWIADCSSCGGVTKVGWKQVINDGCPVCGSHSVSIYHEKNLSKK